jgi:hypothetical protein
MQLAPQIFITLIISVFFAACSSGEGNFANSNSVNSNANSANSNTNAAVKDDTDELEMTIKLPFHPEEAVWREENQGRGNNNSVPPAPSDKKLVAVLRFLKEDANKIVAQAGSYKSPAPEIINTESWFPAELIAQSQTSGDETLKGLSYAANDFLQPPYSDGKITRIEGTDYFVLELFAK